MTDLSYGAEPWEAEDGETYLTLTTEADGSILNHLLIPMELTPQLAALMLTHWQEWETARPFIEG